MFRKKTIFRAARASLAAVLSLAAHPGGASIRCRAAAKARAAINQLQKRNSELEQEVSGLKKRPSWAPVVAGEGKTPSETAQLMREILLQM